MSPAGNLEQLEACASDIVFDGMSLGAAGLLIDANTARRNAVNAAWTAFQAAEVACHNKIVALVGGEPLVVNDGSDKENMYGYRAEDLNAAAGLPWGDVVEEPNPWYYFHEHAWDFTVGFFVDGVGGTIRGGLGTLVGVDPAGTRPARPGPASARRFAPNPGPRSPARCGPVRATPTSQSPRV